MKKLWLPVVAVLLLGALSLAVGSATPDWSDWAHDAILKLRVLRTLGAFAVGAALAVSGAVFQALLRNPLAEPFTLGISGGAGTGAAVVIIAGWGAACAYSVPAGALLGALAVLGIDLWVSGRGSRGEETLLLAGVIAGAVASSILVYLLSIADAEDLAGVTWWLLGDLQSPDPALLFPALAVIVLLIVAAAYWGGELNALSLGQEAAWNLGVAPRRFTVIFVLIGSLLAALTVTLCGIIAFAGLIVPHLARRVYGSDHRKLIVRSALWGGGFLMLSDVLSRVIDPAREIPIGVVTAILGGTVFLALLSRRMAR